MGFQQEAVRRAADIVLSFRRVDTRPTPVAVADGTRLIAER